MAALAAARTLATTRRPRPRPCARRRSAAARANGARLTASEIERNGAVATAVDVTRRSTSTARCRWRDRSAGRGSSAPAPASPTPRRSPSGAFRPVDLHGAQGPLAAVAAAEAQVGWPYVWGGESRAEGGFDCSGLIDYAYAAAGVAHPGAADGRRPVAALRAALG